MPKTLEQAKKEQELVAQARRGEVSVRSKKDVPPKGPGFKTFNVFVDGEYFEVGVEPVRKSGAVSSQRSYPSSTGTVSQKPAVSDGKGAKLLAPMPGMIIRLILTLTVFEQK